MFCLLPSSPSLLWLFLNESRHGNTVQSIANSPIMIMLLTETVNYFGITGSNRDLWSNPKLSLILKMLICKYVLRLKSVYSKPAIISVKLGPGHTFLAKEFFICTWRTSMSDVGNASHCLSIKVQTIQFPCHNPVPSFQSTDCLKVVNHRSKYMFLNSL